MKITTRILFVLIFSLFMSTTVSAAEAEIKSVIFEGLENADDGMTYAHYTVSYSVPAKSGEKIICIFTPVDENDEPYSDGKGSYHFAGNIYKVNQQGDNKLTIEVPTVIIKQIPGTDEYHFAVTIGPETGNAFVTEDLFAFDYSILQETAEGSSGRQKAMNLLDSFFGGDGIGLPSTTEIESSENCPTCYGSGVCRQCNGEGCFACSGGNCSNCNGRGFIYVKKSASDW